MGVPGLLVVDGVDARDVEEPGVVRLDVRVQIPPQRLPGEIHRRGRGGDGEARAAAAVSAVRPEMIIARVPSPCCAWGRRRAREAWGSGAVVQRGGEAEWADH